MSIFIFIVLFASIYLGLSFYRTLPFYSSIKSNSRGWKGVVHRTDAELGFAPIPNSRGEEVFPVGENIPMRYDKHGFRAPVDEKEQGQNTGPTMLFLGCSFTYGAGVRAEDTFPYIAGRHFNGRVENAGVPSYGLSQILILAKKLVPANKPDFLIVQYSPWLSERSVNRFAPAYFGKLPAPYFYETKDGIKIHPPVFKAYLPMGVMDRYRGSKKGIFDFVSFFQNVALPMYIYDDFNIGVYCCRSIFLPKPMNDTEKLTEYVYGEISRIAAENGSKMIIVIIGNDPGRIRLPEGFDPGHIVIVDAHGALLNSMKNIGIGHFLKEYAIWRGLPLRIVDPHLNEKAHKIIAERIIDAINKNPFPQ